MSDRQKVILEKAIRGMECCILRDPDDHHRCEECPYNSHDISNAPCANGLMRDALALLKEQEPVKPIIQKYAACCGNCDEDFIRFFPPNGIEIKYCPFCGRPVKWE